ncbi:MAG: hypothetical protein ACON4Z_08700 [Planctomycetota bacterium]
MSHPLVVEAIETLFTPLCVYNNTEGDRDREALDAYGERTWNNPVVRVVDPERRDRTAPLRRAWSVAGLADLMVRALAADRRAVPDWLALLATSSDVPPSRVESAIFGMS